MRTLYLDCAMGAAGDMLTAALYELLEEEQKKEFLKQMNALGLKEVAVSAEPMTKCGIVGTHMKVSVGGLEEDAIFAHDHEHNHAHDHNHDHEHAHEHSHEHDHNHEHAHNHDHNHEHDHNHAHDHEHEHDHDHAHDHNHEHSHEHDHNHEHAHDHDHNHDHEHSHTHHHSGMADISHIIGHLPLSETVKQNAVEVYDLIAQAESHAHGVEVSDIHFHEVGTLDAVADVTAVCLLMEMLKIEKVYASPVHVGSGHVHCAHGILPVPAPATAFILKEVPIYGGSVQGELCTPTGAALLKHFVSDFGQMPMMKVEKIGYGMGKKDFTAANCVRAMLGETVGNAEKIVELSCNVDDMMPERIGFAMERLLEEGALEAYTVSVGMKKSRPGTMLCVMCKEEDKDKMLRLIFEHTTTLGIRENISNRYTLARRLESIDTAFGRVRVKYSQGYGVSREKYEYEDLAKIAREQGISIDEVVKAIENSRK